MPLATPTSQTHLALDSRLKSFAKPKLKWPHPLSFRATPETLARAGFFFTPEGGRKSDRVTCFVCNKTLAGWDPEDDPFTEHISHSPSCSWALARCSIEALRVGPESTELVFPNEESIPGNPTLEAARLATFGKFWPHDSTRSHSAKAKHMAKAGFIYTPTNDSDDLASCFYCNLGLDGWESTDDPYHEHQRRRPHCAFFTTRLAEESEPEPEPEPKSRRGKTAARKAQPSDPDAEEESAASARPKKSAKPVTSTALKRAASKSSKPAKSTPPAQVKSEPIDDLPLGPPKAKPKLRKSQSQGQLSTSQSQNGSGKPQLVRSQSQIGYASVRSANVNTPPDEEEAPVVAKKKVGGKTKSRAVEPEEEEEPSPLVTKSKGKVKRPIPAVVDEAEPEGEEDEEEPVPEPPPSKAKAKAPKGRFTKPKPKPPTPEPQGDESETEEPGFAPVPVKTKAKAGGNSKASASKTKRGAKGKKAEQGVPSESVGEESAVEAEPGPIIEPEVLVESESEQVAPPPKKTRAKKTAGATKKGAKGKKGKARGAEVDVETQAESESQAQSESQAEAESEMEADEPQTAQTPRPPVQSHPIRQDDTPRAGGVATSGLSIPARRTPSPTRLPVPEVGGARSADGTPRAVLGTSAAAETPKAASNALGTPKFIGAQKTPVGAGASRIGTPSTTVTPRPATLQTSPMRPVFGVPTRSPAPRHVFGSANTNANANVNSNPSVNIVPTNPNVDTVMASPSRLSKAPAPTRVGTVRSPGARNLCSPGLEPTESSVPFPRDSSPMTPTKLKAVPAPSTLPIITSVLANPTAATGPPVDMSLAELDSATRALTLEAYVRREMTMQYEALKADCEREIEEFLKAAKETRAKIAAL